MKDPEGIIDPVKNATPIYNVDKKVRPKNSFRAI